MAPACICGAGSRTCSRDRAPAPAGVPDRLPGFADGGLRALDGFEQFVEAKGAVGRPAAREGRAPQGRGDLMGVAHQDPLAALDADDSLAAQSALAGPGRRQRARSSLAPLVPNQATDASHGKHLRPNPMDPRSPSYMKNVYFSTGYRRLRKLGAQMAANCMLPVTRRPHVAPLPRLWHAACSDKRMTRPPADPDGHPAVRSRTIAVRERTIRPRQGLVPGENEWRPEPESNRRARICSPLRNHSAIGPRSARFPAIGAEVKGDGRSTGDPEAVRAHSSFDQWRLARCAASGKTGLLNRCIIGIEQP